MQAINSTAVVNQSVLSLMGGLQTVTEPEHLSFQERVPSGRPSYLVTGVSAVATFFAVTANPVIGTAAPIPSQASRSFASIDRAAGMLEAREVALQEMLEYREIEDGWDGIKSVKPKPGAIDDAIAFFQAIPKEVTPPEATVSADGSVGWFWKDQGNFASVEFVGDNRFAYYARAKENDLTARGASVYYGKSIPEELLKIMELF